MRGTLAVVAGGLLFLVGALWTMQGLGYVSGSPMSGVEVWAIIGPIVGGLGVALMIVGLRGQQRR